MKQETFEEIKVIKRTELYNSILSIVKQIPRKEVDGDAVDAPSCAYELEQLFLKWQQERSYSEEEVLELLQNFNQNAMEYIKQDDRNIMTSVTLQKWFVKFKKK